uniref:Uncharacterized protein n=1 Tax=candidate division CPR3 bacterium TaxID=2268181 RepID=A0A7C4R5M5_UNCC3
MLEDKKTIDNSITEDYDKPDIIGEIDTVHEQIEYMEKKLKIPVWIWVFLIIIISIVTLYVTMGQSPTININ